MVVQLEQESRPLSFAPEFLTRHRLSGRSDRRKAKRARPTLGRWTIPTTPPHTPRALEVNVAVTCKLWDIRVADSRETYRTANDTRFIVGEAETFGRVNPQGSDDVTSDLKKNRNFHPSNRQDYYCYRMRTSSLRCRLKRPGTPQRKTPGTCHRWRRLRNSMSRQRRSVSECQSGASVNTTDRQFVHR